MKSRPCQFALSLVLAVSPLLAAAQFSPAPSPEATQAPPVIALLAAVGDQMNVVRQKESVGSNLDPFNRRVVPLPGQAINMAVLRGLDRGIAQEDPSARRVLLRWSPPAELLQSLNELRGPARDDALLQALLSYLRELPQRQEWDRIEAVLPAYFRAEVRGMGSKLQGIGIYVQPLDRGFDITEEGLVDDPNDTRGYSTVDPKTGRVRTARSFVAPYMYFERITLDARSLEVLARKRQLDNIKFHDPMSEERDVSAHLSQADLMGRLLSLAERSAYQSIRGKQGTVEVTAPVPVAPPATPATAASAPGTGK